jgi:hypothetical protein
MRRYLAIAPLFVVLSLNFGCSHIAGMNDVYHHPDNAIINTGNGNPYHPVTAAPIAPAAAAAPAIMMPAADKPMEKPMDKQVEKAK